MTTSAPGADAASASIAAQDNHTTLRPQIPREVLAGIVTSLALVPEVISFAFISGVEPRAALFASVVLLVVTSLFGGRPAMVTAAAGSVALVVGPMVREHGVAYVLPAVLLAGTIQVAFGLGGFARMIRFIPRSVMLGFVNALGILIFCAQVPHVWRQTAPVYVLFALTVGLVLLLPRVTRAVPSPLVAIAAATVVAGVTGWAVPTVGGNSPMATGLPGLTPWAVPLTLATLKIVLQTAISIAFVGLLESLLTAKLVDDMTDSRTRPSKESWALGLANLCAGWWGGIAGCAMIGQTVVNAGIGGARMRLSTLASAVTLLLLITTFSHVMARMPLVALAAVMMIVALKTVDWHSLRPATLRRMPLMETSVMVLTMGVTIATGNLAFGVAGGVLLAMVMFARRVAHVIRTTRVVNADGASVRYTVHGPLFFGSSNDLVDRFSYAADPGQVVIDFSQSQIWDASTVAALDAIENKYRAQGAQVRFTGLDERSKAFHARLTGCLNVH